MNGKGFMLSGFYRMTGVNSLLAEQEQFSSATTLRIVELDRSPQDKAMGQFKTQSLTYIRQRALDLIPPLRKGKFVAENNPTTNSARCIGNSVKHRAKRLVNIEGTNPDDLGGRGRQEVQRAGYTKG